jgi:hypothetical protein
MHLITIAFEQLIGIHPKLSEPVKATSQLMYTGKITDFSPAGLEKLLLLYPIHVVKDKQNTECYHVVAGLRQYELLCVYYAVNPPEQSPTKHLQTIPVIEHDKLTARSISDLASCDIAGSALLFSLGTKVGAQLTMIRDSLEPAIIEQFPKYRSERRMVERPARKVREQ